MKEDASFYCSKCKTREHFDDNGNLPNKCPKCGNKAICTLVWYDLESEHNFEDRKIT